MDHTTDDKVLIPEMKKLQEHHEGKIKSASFDKGFWSPENWSELDKIVTLACLPKKGKRNKEENKREGAPEFGKMRRWHTGIESAIHALGSGNGLALC